MSEGRNLAQTNLSGRSHLNRTIETKTTSPDEPDMTWQNLLIALAVIFLTGTITLLIWWWRSAMTRTEALAQLRSLGIEIVLLPGRLRRMANDPRVPPRTRWWMVGLAIYIASPIDLIPDFIPVIGFADELVIVPLVLWHIRRMIPAEVWAEYFPPREGSDTAPAGHTDDLENREPLSGGGDTIPR